MKEPPKALNGPMYRSAETHRDYQTFLLRREYVNGWNDAMDFVFGKPEHRPEFKIVRSDENGCD